MKYDKLEPGLYIQRGDAIKAIDTPLVNMLLGNTPETDIERYAEEVSWVFIALNKRKTLMKELLGLGSWMSGNDEAEMLPFVFHWQRDFPRIDEALQTTGQGYLLKQRKGRLLVGFRWLDPDAVQPDEKTLEAVTGGVRYGRYFYTDVNGTRQAIDAMDIIHFYIPGRSDGVPGTSAGVATRLAGSILHNMDLTFASFYANNALPVMLVHVPMGTGEPDKKELESRFRRLFNPKRSYGKESRTIAVREGVTVTPLTINPNDLDAQATTERQIKAIALAHDVPYEELVGDSNYATAVDTRRGWVATMGQRIEDIALVIASDPEIKQLRLTYDARISEHWSMRRDEVEAAGAIATYVQAGYTVWAAGFLLGITEDRFPEEIKQMGIYRETVEPGASADTVTGTSEGGEFAASNTGYNPPGDEFDIKAVAWMEEARRFKRWYKKRDNPNPAEFNSDILTDDDKGTILYGGVNGDAAIKAAYWETLTAVNRTLEAVMANENNIQA